MADLQDLTDRLVKEVDSFLEIPPGPRVLVHDLETFKTRFMKKLFDDVPLINTDDAKLTNKVNDFFDAITKDMRGCYHYFFPNEIFVDFSPKSLERKLMHEAVHARLDMIRQGDLDSVAFMKRRKVYAQARGKFLDEGFCDFVPFKLGYLSDDDFILLATSYQQFVNFEQKTKKPGLFERLKKLKVQFEESGLTEEHLTRGKEFYWCQVVDEKLGRTELLDIVKEPVADHKKWFFGWTRYKASQKELDQPEYYIRRRLKEIKKSNYSRTPNN